MNQFILSELPPSHPLVIYKGDDTNLPFVLEEGQDGGPYEAIDLTGSEFAMRIQQRRGATEVLTLTTGNGKIVITDADGGEFKVVISSSDSEDFPVNCDLQYDLQWTDADDNKKTILRGTLRAVSEITT